MHVSGFPFDLSWFLQFIFTAFLIALGLLHLVKNTASKYFMVDSSFEASDPASPLGSRKMPAAVATRDSCEVCGNSTKKQCSGCKLVKYCSETCQRTHWISGHKTKCKDFQLSGKVNSMLAAPMQNGRGSSSAVALVPPFGTTNIVKQPKEILFPYEEFVELFNWDKPGLPPCGLLNCGNSCFANVVLQCLYHTRPLVAYLLEKGHRRECRRNDWCFLCELQSHVERASESLHPFSPINILSRLPHIGGNLGYGKQEDAHEFMRFAIDTMQSVCLDEYGGEKVLQPSTQETTLIQHIFGGHLQSQVICAKCNNISNQCENMMDLTVEIHGDAASLEECLDQFTVKEQLHGDNMYKCDGCNDYVMAWKRLTIRRAPNILTIALKRFQSGRFGKLNKRVTFPETLDLRPYMSEVGDGKDIYKLYAVVVHVDMLNASFFGHYICYTKDICGKWYRIDDCKVTRADLEEVLSQGAYMLFYSRVCARPTCLKPIESLGKEKEIPKVEQEEPSTKQLIEGSTNAFSDSDSLSSHNSSQPKLPTCGNQLSSITNSEDVREDMDIDSEGSLSGLQDDEIYDNGCSHASKETVSPVVHANRLVSGVISSLNETYKSEIFSMSSEFTTSSSGTEDSNGVENSTKKFTGSSESSLLPFRTVELASPKESSLPRQNGSFEKVEVSHDALVGLSTEECVDEINSTIGSKGEEAGMGLSPSNCVKSGAMKLNGRTTSGAKLKPLFAPGFLGKRTGNKPMKRDRKASTEMGEIAADACKLEESSESSKPGFLYQNGNTSIKHIGEPRTECDGLLPPQGERVRNSEPGRCSNFCNGDAGACVISDVCNTTKDDQPLEGITSNHNEGLHEERKPILTE